MQYHVTKTGREEESPRAGSLFMRSINLLATVFPLAIVAAACSAGADPDVGGATATVVTADTPGAFSCEGVPGEGVSGSLVEQIPSSPRESGPSALANPTDPSFPAALVDVNAIRSGGPPPDGIPPIENPRFASIADTDFLADCEAVVVLDIDGAARAYPIQIMTFHEIVNDAFGDVPVTVSYCPLCNSAVAYDRRLGDRVLDFGTSGQLFNSSLVMYDRQTESLWTHFDGKAVVGTLAGAELEQLPMQTLSYGDFTAAYPDGLVLTRDTGASRDYGRNPYSSYDDPDGTGRAFLFDGNVPDTYTDTTRVIGIDHNDAQIAVLHDLAFANNVVPVDANGDDLVVFVQPGVASALERATVAGGRDVGASGVFRSTIDGTRLTFTWDGETFVDDQTSSSWTVTGLAIAGEYEGRQLEAVVHLDTFWFAWNAFHPATEVVA